ncbi:hypothetical protein AMELA_G00076800 [Ameiurus melas]|uniref:Uncharacterized protein n=1 Tax=Ameiurus melas TaxID=219545 RepID=A0A7J6B0J8_AMEME|nr:hypothetical protein AMELA_G00076800 [Ameiurus melas]
MNTSLFFGMSARLDKAACPVYPTELVIGLDMSDDVTPALFGRMRSTLLSLLDSIDITESNCPTGTRVAVVSYSSNTKYLIRFSDYRYKKDLVEAVKNIPRERITNRRNMVQPCALWVEMSSNVFGQGVLIRKVAIFLSGGQSQDVTSITTAVLEYKALDINLGVIGFRDTPNVQRAFEADETGSFINVLERSETQSAALAKIQRCIICFDPCNPARDCPSSSEVSTPEQVDVDLALLVDGSRSIQADQYEGVKQVLGTVVDQLVVSRQPSKADRQAHALRYQQSSSYREAQAPVKQIFSFQQFQDRNQMKQSIFENLQQTGGYSRLGHAMEFIIMQGLLTVSKPRKNKMSGIVLTALRWRSLPAFPEHTAAACIGFGWGAKQGEQEYTRRFIRTFLHILSREMNTYPAPLLRQQCEDSQQQQGQVNVRDVFETAKRPPIHRFPLPILAILTSVCGDSNDMCFLESDGGPCRDYVLKWYYDQEKNRCIQFWYGGCDGNLNRFDSQKDCEACCVELPIV